MKTSLENPENFTSIPLKERTSFELLLMRTMLGSKLVHEAGNEWRKEENKWVETYAKKVGDIIDNVENKELRKLIMEDRYEEAADVIMEMLKMEPMKAAA